MNQREMEDLKKLLKESLPSVHDAGLRRDLWPAMQERLAQRALRVPWWDWALLVGAGLLIWLFPGMIPALLYHL
jgi:hypothetical protein